MAIALTTATFRKNDFQKVKDSLNGSTDQESATVCVTIAHKEGHSSITFNPRFASVSHSDVDELKNAVNRATIDDVSEYVIISGSAADGLHDILEDPSNLMSAYKV
ncbi:hypothetical protein H4219_003671 [Mycoemilia scoparia]|uniref:Uncharacterized protein n=1 Tax=Mycoemilia scoparia TaxID=417184 RepID=A0A9W8DT19_9FUNG|nr:hypothetical protein H4219_003671 [Mycoemilia scoparia]